MRSVVSPGTSAPGKSGVKSGVKYVHYLQADECWTMLQRLLEGTLLLWCLLELKCRKAPT